MVTTASGYICKQCHQPAPMGIGYPTDDPVAAAHSPHIERCHCGWSQSPQTATEQSHREHWRAGFKQGYTSARQWYIAQANQHSHEATKLRETIEAISALFADRRNTSPPDTEADKQFYRTLNTLLP